MIYYDATPAQLVAFLIGVVVMAALLFLITSGDDDDWWGLP